MMFSNISKVYTSVRWWEYIFFPLHIIVNLLPNVYILTLAYENKYHKCALFT